MGQIWLFWKLAHISQTASCREKISLILTPRGRKRVLIQLRDLFFKFQVHTLMLQCWNLAHVSETAAHRVKISSPWGRKRVYLQLWNLCKWPSSISKNGNFEIPACRAKTSSISTPLGKRVYIQFPNLELCLSFSKFCFLVIIASLCTVEINYVAAAF